MPTSVGQAMVTIDADYRHALIGADDAHAQMSFALLKMMDSGRPFYTCRGMDDLLAAKPGVPDAASRSSTERASGKGGTPGA